MNVKICGITRPEDALLAEKLGAWAVGLIFWSGSTRGLNVEGGEIVTRALQGSTLPIGVFVDSEFEEIENTVNRCQLRGVQLHGDEPVDFIERLRARFPDLFLIRAFQASTEEELEIARPFMPFLDAVLFDSKAPDGSKGGTGIPGDWELVTRARAKFEDTRIILAGGLRSDNVAEAIRITRPFAVDVASGVEEMAGIKCELKMRRLFKEARRV